MGGAGERGDNRNNYTTDGGNVAGRDMEDEEGNKKRPGPETLKAVADRKYSFSLTGSETLREEEQRKEGTPAHMVNFSFVPVEQILRVNAFAQSLSPCRGMKTYRQLRCTPRTGNFCLHTSSYRRNPRKTNNIGKCVPLARLHQRMLMAGSSYTPHMIKNTSPLS